MRVGVSLTSAHPGVEAREGARMMIARAAAARAAGLDSLFIGDHHGTPTPYFQNVPMLGRLLAEWGDAPAGCLFLLPLWNPVIVAEQVGTLASIHTGRFIVQAALGDGMQQFTSVGASLRTRPSVFEESLGIVRALLAGETVDGGGRFSAIHHARISPTPPEPVHFWLGGSVEASVYRAARLGDAWLGGPELPNDHANHWMDYYATRRASLGLEPGVAVLRRDVFVGESDAHAHQVAGPIIARGYRGIAKDSLVVGSVDTVAARFLEYERMGFAEVLIRHLTDDQDLVLGSFRRLAEVRKIVSG